MLSPTPAIEQPVTDSGISMLSHSNGPQTHPSDSGEVSKVLHSPVVKSNTSIVLSGSDLEVNAVSPLHLYSLCPRTTRLDPTLLVYKDMLPLRFCSVVLISSYNDGMGTPNV